jgi:hypothetical protein
MALLSAYPSTGNRKLNLAIVLFGFFLLAMKIISAFRGKE